jgi:hypothetical protein
MLPYNRRLRKPRGLPSGAQRLDKPYGRKLVGGKRRHGDHGATLCIWATGVVIIVLSSVRNV